MNAERSKLYFVPDLSDFTDVDATTMVRHRYCRQIYLRGGSGSLDRMRRRSSHDTPYMRLYRLLCLSMPLTASSYTTPYMPLYLGVADQSPYNLSSPAHNTLHISSHRHLHCSIYSRVDNGALDSSSQVRQHDMHGNIWSFPLCLLHFR